MIGLIYNNQVHYVTKFEDFREVIPDSVYSAVEMFHKDKVRELEADCEYYSDLYGEEKFQKSQLEEENAALKDEVAKLKEEVQRLYKTYVFI